MASLSVCAVVRNEAKDLARGLNSLKGVYDELIIVDTGSTDSTVQTAQSYTAKVLFFEWCDDFAAAQNFAYSHATEDFILKWDGDFYLTPESVTELKKAKTKDFYGADLLTLQWHTEHSPTGQPLKTIPRTLLSKAGKFRWHYPVHARLHPVFKTKARVHHLNNVAINHQKDKVFKKHRYSQTQTILKNYLLDCPENAYLRFFEAEGLMFRQEYEQAKTSWEEYLATADAFKEPEIRQIQALERLIYTCLQFRPPEKVWEVWKKHVEDHPQWKNHPLLILARADLLSLTEPNEAVLAYTHYLQVTNQPGPHTQDYVRHRIHPYRMLSWLIPDTDQKEMYKVIAETNARRKNLK